jgi:hypothetical protein
LPSYIRQDRKGKGLPTAVAVAAPMIGSGRKEVIVMATEFAKTIKLGPFSRERWTTTFPKFSQFHLIREVRERGDYAMTWRLNSDRAGQLEAYLIALVKSGDGKAVAGETYQWARFYPMYGGVRRQLRRILTAARKLWTATRKEQDWPGQDPEKLPILVGFYREQK